MFLIYNTTCTNILVQCCGNYSVEKTMKGNNQMKKLNINEMKNINGGKTVRCPECGKKVNFGFIYPIIRFWWSKSTWETVAASAHYNAAGNYVSSPH